MTCPTKRALIAHYRAKARAKIWNVSLRKIGGIWFLKLGRINLSASVSKPAAADSRGNRHYPVPASWQRLCDAWDAEAMRVHDDLAGKRDRKGYSRR